MEIKPPLISVVCPVWNSASFVSKTLQSVLGQTQLPFELIVSDDGSTDNTIEVIECLTQGISNPTVRVIRNQHKGPGAARNAGIYASQGEWIAFLDSDDRWHPKKIMQVSQAILDRPEANFFCHNEYHRLLNGQEVIMDLASRYRHDVPLPKQLFTNYFIATSAVVCKRDVLLSHNGFDETLSSAQDYEMWLRMSPSLNIYMIPHALGWYIDRRGNVSSKNRWRHYRNVLRAFSKNKEYINWWRYDYAVIRYTAIFCKNQLVAFVAKNR